MQTIRKVIGVIMFVVAAIMLIHALWGCYEWADAVIYNLKEGMTGDAYIPFIRTALAYFVELCLVFLFYALVLVALGIFLIYGISTGGAHIAPANNALPGGSEDDDDDSEDEIDKWFEDLKKD